MEQEDLTEKDLTLSVLLPEGHEKTVTVHGSKPVMDVLVILCARYHLNPSDHVIELFSMNHNKLKFKPSSLIGSLEAELVVLKPKRSDVRKAPNMPVATVRLLINYRKSHKAVVRVSPKVPLAELMPTVCEKCEMDPKNTVLLRDSQSEEPLDLMKTLNDYGIRDVYAKAVSGTPNDPAALTQKDCKKEKLLTQEKVLGEKENRGLLNLFRRSKKSAEETPTNTDPISAAASLVLKDQHAINTRCSEANSTSEMPKKRRAPQPPSMLGSQSASAEPNSGQQAALPSTDNEKEGVLSRVSSTDSSLKRNKHRAPPPPCTSPSLANKERSSILENDEEDDSAEAVFKQSSHFKPNRSSIQWSPLMTEVVSELTDRIKSMEQKDASFDWSVIPSRPAPNLPLVSGSVVDADPVLPPGCQLPRNGSQRDSVSTFTVVPRKRPQSTRQYEFLLTMKDVTVNRDAGEHLEDRVSESRETEKMETSSKEMVMLKNADDEFENVVETNQEPGIAEGFGKLHLNIDVEEHLVEENLAMEHLTKEHLIEEHLTKKHFAKEHLTKEHLPEEHLTKEHLIEEQLLKEHLAKEHLTEKHLAKEHLAEKHLSEEKLAKEHLTEKHLKKEHLAEKHLPEEHLLEEQLTKEHLARAPLTKKHLAMEHLAEKQLAEEHLEDEHPAEKHLSEDRDRMEVQDERDWIKEYVRRRGRFLNDYDYGKETKLRKAFYEEMLDDVPPHPSQLSVCWEEEEEPETPEEPEGLGKEETEEDKSKANRVTLKNLNPSEESYFDVNLSPNLHSSNSTPFTSSSQSNLQDHQPTSLRSASPHGSRSKLEPSFKRSSPNSPSLFSLAVSQRVQSLGNAFSPSIPSTRTISSPTPHPQRVGSQHTSSQKLYFQSLISEEIVSKFPASLEPCGEAPPTVVITTQARRKAWSSFSRTQLKNLEQV